MKKSICNKVKDEHIEEHNYVSEQLEELEKRIFHLEKMIAYLHQTTQMIGFNFSDIREFQEEWQEIYNKLDFYLN